MAPGHVYVNMYSHTFSYRFKMCILSTKLIVFFNPSICCKRLFILLARSFSRWIRSNFARSNVVFCLRCGVSLFIMLFAASIISLVDAFASLSANIYSMANITWWYTLTVLLAMLKIIHDRCVFLLFYMAEWNSLNSTTKKLSSAMKHCLSKVIMWPAHERDVPLVWSLELTNQTSWHRWFKPTWPL